MSILERRVKVVLPKRRNKGESVKEDEDEGVIRNLEISSAVEEDFDQVAHHLRESSLEACLHDSHLMNRLELTLLHINATDSVARQPGFESLVFYVDIWRLSRLHHDLATEVVDIDLTFVASFCLFLLSPHGLT